MKYENKSSIRICHCKTSFLIINSYVTNKNIKLNLKFETHQKNIKWERKKSKSKSEHEPNIRYLGFPNVEWFQIESVTKLRVRVQVKCIHELHIRRPHFRYDLILLDSSELIGAVFFLSFFFNISFSYLLLGNLGCLILCAICPLWLLSISVELWLYHGSQPH